MNWENPKVREEIKGVLKFWLDLGADGFRCDVINLISKKQDFKSRFPLPALTGMDAFINGPRLHEYLHELYVDVLSKYDCMTVGEAVMATPKVNISLVDPKREELDMIFNFSHTDSDNFFGIKYFYRKFKLTRFKRRLNKQQLSLAGKGWNSLFIENHDQRRSVGRFGTTEDDINSSKSLAATYFFLQGTPFIYQGQEFGMRNAHFESMGEIRDIESYNVNTVLSKSPFFKKQFKQILFDVSRDNARTPVLWDDSENGGFSKVTPWIRANSSKNEVNAKRALADKDSLYYFYKDLIQLKYKYKVIEDGKFKMIKIANPHFFAYERENDQEKIIVISSFSKKNKRFKYSENLSNNDIILSNFKEHEKEFKPFETRVYLIKKS